MDVVFDLENSDVTESMERLMWRVSGRGAESGRAAVALLCELPDEEFQKLLLRAD